MQGDFFYALCDEFIKAGINEDCPIVPRDQLPADANYLELLENGQPTSMVINLDEPVWCGWEELPCQGALVFEHYDLFPLTPHSKGGLIIGDFEVFIVLDNASVENRQAMIDTGLGNVQNLTFMIQLAMDYHYDVLDEKVGLDRVLWINPPKVP